MFNVVPFISSIGLAIFAEADLRFGDFLTEVCHHKLVVSTSFWSWLLNVSSVLTSFKFTDPLLWVLLRYGFVDNSWEFWVFDFGFFCF